MALPLTHRQMGTAVHCGATCWSLTQVNVMAFLRHDGDCLTILGTDFSSLSFNCQFFEMLNSTTSYFKAMNLPHHGLICPHSLTLFVCLMWALMSIWAHMPTREFPFVPFTPQQHTPQALEQKMSGKQNLASAGISSLPCNCTSQTIPCSEKVCDDNSLCLCVCVGGLILEGSPGEFEFKKTQALLYLCGFEEST